MKSCRELKEKLNSGVSVQLDCEHILVIASVLKVEKHLSSCTMWCSSGEKFLVSFIMMLLPAAKNHNRFRISKVLKNTLESQQWPLKAAASNMTCQTSLYKTFHPALPSSSWLLPSHAENN